MSACGRNLSPKECRELLQGLRNKLSGIQKNAMRYSGCHLSGIGESPKSLSLSSPASSSSSSSNDITQTKTHKVLMVLLWILLVALIVFLIVRLVYFLKFKSPYSEARVINQNELLKMFPNNQTHGNTGVVMFANENCGPCRQLMPFYKQAALNSDVPFYIYNVQPNDPHSNRYNITATPSIIKFVNGNIVGQWQNKAANQLAVADLKNFAKK